MKKIKYRLLVTILLIFLNITLVSANETYSKAVIDINDITILEIQDAYQKGYLTSELLVTLYLDRIDKYNSKYKAITQINDKALATAKELDLERKEKGPRSLLHGIPVVIKDNYDFVGLPTTAGTRALLDSYPQKKFFYSTKIN